MMGNIAKMEGMSSFFGNFAHKENKLSSWQSAKNGILCFTGYDQTLLYLIVQISQVISLVLYP